MRSWPSGVSVVTAAHGARRAGMTVSAFFSVSLEPPVVLVSLHAGADTLALARASGTFAVSILADDGRALSERFSRPPSAERFDGVRTSTRTTGAPVLDDAAAWVDCRVREAHEVGTHVLLLGDVVATGTSPSPRPPLVYADRGYRRLAPG